MYNNILSPPSTQQNYQENQYTPPTGEENKVFTLPPLFTKPTINEHILMDIYCIKFIQTG